MHPAKHDLLQRERLILVFERVRLTQGKVIAKQAKTICRGDICSWHSRMRWGAERSVMLRQQRNMKWPDAIMLATAQVNARQLITRNHKDVGGLDGVVIPC